MTIEERFWSKVVKTDSCWLWNGAKSAKGYGVFEVYGHTERAHRVSYRMAHGPVKSNMLICHKCNNPGCVNPNHLYMGTNGDNMRDRFRKKVILCSTAASPPS
jgi:hypothetical protein